MTSMSDRGSAKIYQFPVGGRSASRASRAAVVELTAANLPKIEFGGSWYHDAAIEEELQTRKRDGH
jgi:hypothetical protein